MWSMDANQQFQRSSADGAILQGAILIVDGKCVKGLKYWGKTTEARCGPITVVPEEILPPWTTVDRSS